MTRQNLQTTIQKIEILTIKQLSLIVTIILAFFVDKADSYLKFCLAKKLAKRLKNLILIY